MKKNTTNELFDAAYKNEVEKIRVAIGEGADPNAQHPRSGTIPLQLACQANALDAIRVLLDLGAKPGLRFTRVSRVDGRVFANHVPLMYVESDQAAKLLVDAGADIDPRDELDWTPMARSAFAGNVDVVRYFLGVGASVDVYVQYDGRKIRLIDLVESRLRDLEAVTDEQKREDLAQTLIGLREVASALVSQTNL